MFPLTADRKASEDNEFMEMECTFSREDQRDLMRESVPASFLNATDRTGEANVAFVGDVNSGISISNPQSPVAQERRPRNLKVRDVSRLWQYRNGTSPCE